MNRLLVLCFALTACNGGANDSDTAVVDPTRCELLGMTESPFEDGGDGGLNGLAGDFSVQTRSGSFSLSTDWSGCDSLVFVLGAPRQNSSFSVDMWARDHEDLLANSPDNVHYFFVPNDGADVASRLDVIEQGLVAALDRLSGEEQAAWEGRLHYVEQTPSDIDGWLGIQLANPGWGLVIDRSQTVRYVGSYADSSRFDGGVGWFEPNLSKVANEARYANFTFERQERLDSEDVTSVRLWDNEQVQGSPRIDVTLPDAATMATFDTLEYDLTTNCVGDGEFGDCPAWDYLVYLYQCDDAVDDVSAFGSTACQPHVPETLGMCHADGVQDTETCRASTDCEDDSETSWTCVGFVDSVDADTRPGSCDSPIGEATEGTYTCNDAGTGYDDLVCGCGTEVGRWITTYHREGRWVHDATPFLAMMQEGGDKTYRFRTSQPYDLTLDFRFSNRGVGYRPTSMSRLYNGNFYYGPTVNDLFEPLDVDVPAGAAHVELAAVVSGHGGGQLNCAEFCHTTNHFIVGDDAFVVEDDWVDVQDGCEQQVDAGTIPNQYGTWWYGRNSWCPGKEVQISRFDLDGLVTPGSSIQFDHETYGPNERDLNGGGGERVEVQSWMVVYE